MYSYEQRVTAVKLLIQYDMSYSTVIQELGYPNNSKSLRYWCFSQVRMTAICAA